MMCIKNSFDDYYVFLYFSILGNSILYFTKIVKEIRRRH